MTLTFSFESRNFTHMDPIKSIQTLVPLGFWHELRITYTYVCYIYGCVCVCLCTFKFANPTFVHDKHCLTDITVMPTVNWQIVKWQATSALFDCWTSIHFGPKWPATTRQSITARLSDDAHSMPMTVWV